MSDERDDERSEPPALEDERYRWTDGEGLLWSVNGNGRFHTFAEPQGWVESVVAGLGSLLLIIHCQQLATELAACRARRDEGSAVMDPNAVVKGACLACAHILPLAVWDARLPEFGVCAECLQLAAPNRGNCSHIRGCDCTQDGVSWRIRDAERAGATAIRWIDPAADEEPAR